MSLHDIDKDSPTRLTPRPNSDDEQVKRMAHNTMGTTYRKDTDTNTQRVSFKNGLILYYDDADRIIRVDGFIPAVADYPVTIIAKYGYDVFTDVLGISRPTT